MTLNYNLKLSLLEIRDEIVSNTLIQPIKGSMYNK